MTWQPELAECCIKHGPHVLGAGSRHRLAAQEIPAVGIRQRQRLTTAAVAGQEPALEVDTPHVIGGSTMRKWCARGWTAAPQPPLHSQSLTIEQGANRARRRPVLRRPAAFQIGP